MLYGGCEYLLGSQSVGLGGRGAGDQCADWRGPGAVPASSSQSFPLILYPQWSSQDQSYLPVLTQGRCVPLSSTYDKCWSGFSVVVESEARIYVPRDKLEDKGGGWTEESLRSKKEVQLGCPPGWGEVTPTALYFSLEDLVSYNWSMSYEQKQTHDHFFFLCTFSLKGTDNFSLFTVKMLILMDFFSGWFYHLFKLMGCTMISSACSMLSCNWRGCACLPYNLGWY